MFLTYKKNKYPCGCSINDGTSISYNGLPEGFPVPVSGSIELCANDGFVLRTDSVADYRRQSFENGVLLLTNALEEPGAPTPEPQPDPQADIDAMLVDHEFRLTLLELGLTE